VPHASCVGLQVGRNPLDVVSQLILISVLSRNDPGLLLSRMKPPRIRSLSVRALKWRPTRRTCGNWTSLVTSTIGTTPRQTAMCLRMESAFLCLVQPGGGKCKPTYNKASPADETDRQVTRASKQQLNLRQLRPKHQAHLTATI
jgi:hypothetical protein